MFLFCFSSSCVSYVASFSVFSFFDCTFGILTFIQISGANGQDSCLNIATNVKKKYHDYFSCQDCTIVIKKLNKMQSS